MIIDTEKIARDEATEEELAAIDKAKESAAFNREAYAAFRKRGAFVPSVNGLESLLHSVELTPGQAESLHRVIDGRVRRRETEAVTSDPLPGTGGIRITREVPRIEAPIEAEKKAATWGIAILAEVVDGELGAKTSLKEFTSREEARAYVGKLTSEINNAVIGGIALVCIGDLALRPQDVAAIEVYEV